MIFATDMDRTMIYSNKFINDSKNYFSIETKDNKSISYMTHKAYELFKKIAKNYPLIPVTTRGLDEYKRINLNNIDINYYIINNGGRIFIHGQEDKEWSSHIQNNISKLECSIKEIEKEFLKEVDISLFSKSKLSDELMWVYVFKEEQTPQNLKEIKEKFKSYGWLLEQTGKKIYLIPEFMNKWEAISYVNHKYLDNQKIVAAGDSNMDLKMVLNADYGCIPKHGEICSTVANNLFISENKGLLAGEEILNHYYDIITSTN